MIESGEEQSGAEYLAPTTVDEALALLGEHGDEARIVGGGQSLLVFLRQGLLAPRWLIGLKQIPELAHIERSAEGGLAIGAMVTQHRLEHDPLVAAGYPALAEAAAAVSSPPIRRQGTLGGNLCHADPTGDPPAALIALGAEVEIAGQHGRRRVPVSGLFRGFLETAVEADELMVAVHVPPVGPRTGAAYLKHRVRGVDYALVGVGFGLTLAEDSTTCSDVRIGLAGVGDTPLRAVNAEAVLRGQPIDDETLRAAGEAAAAECRPPSDTEGSEWYRREMVKVFVRRAGEIALQRAGGQ